MSEIWIVHLNLGVLEDTEGEDNLCTFFILFKNKSYKATCRCMAFVFGVLPIEYFCGKNEVLWIQTLNYRLALFSIMILEKRLLND